MENRAVYHLHVFGVPYAVRKDDPTAVSIKLKRTLAWSLLVRMLDGTALTRAELTAQLDIHDESLTQALKACRDTFGKDCIEEIAGKRLRLKPGRFTSDWQQFHDLKRHAITTSEPAARIALYDKAYHLITGTLLAKCRSREMDWTRTQEESIAKIGIELITYWEHHKDTDKSCEIAGRLATLLPHDPTVRAALLRVNALRHSRPPDKSRAETQWDAYTRQLEQHGITIDLSNPQHREQFLCREYELLEAHCPLLRQLCIFDGSFDSELAYGAFGIAEQELCELTDRVLLLENAGRYEMPPLIRDWLRERLSSSERQDYEQKYLAGVVHHEMFKGHKSHSEQGIREYFQSNPLHINFACSLLDVKMAQRSLGLTCQEYTAYCASLGRGIFDNEADRFVRLRDYALYFPIVEPFSGYISGMLSGSALRLRMWDEGLRFARAFLTAAEEDKDEGNGIMAAMTIITSLHHCGQSALAAELGLETLARTRRWQHDVLWFKNYSFYGLHHLLSEIFCAVSRFEEALECSNAVLDAKARGLLPHSPASALYNKGMALRGLERKDEAMTAWNQALYTFTDDKDPHGIADCKQQLGVLMAEMGMTAPGEQFVREAIQIYEAIPQLQSRAACLKSLGDVLKIKGEHNNAQNAYCEGLAFWEELEHPRWTARFRQRLESLDSQNDSDSENGILKEQNAFSVEETQG